jgi:hypothetical protein
MAPPSSAQSRRSNAVSGPDDAGVDELFVQQIGPEDAFFTTWARKVLAHSG